MTSDITLDMAWTPGDNVNVKTQFFVVTATDLILDNPSRRIKGQPPNYDKPRPLPGEPHQPHQPAQPGRQTVPSLRRALVHDFEDGLTINWDGDYPGGVTILGELKTDHIKTRHVDLGGALAVTLILDMETGDVLAPSELTAEVREAAAENTRRYRPGGPAEAGAPVAALSLSESRAVLANAGVTMVKRIPLMIDLVKMVVDLSEEVNQLKKRIEILEAGG
jgi:hypothetical protein